MFLLYWIMFYMLSFSEYNSVVNVIFLLKLLLVGGFSFFYISECFIAFLAS